MLIGIHYLYTELLLFFLVRRFYLFIFGQGKGDRKKGRETSVCGCFSHALYWGPGLQLRHVLWLGIELVTLWFTGWHSVHWATPAQTRKGFINPFILFHFWLSGIGSHHSIFNKGLMLASYLFCCSVIVD